MPLSMSLDLSLCDGMDMACPYGPFVFVCDRGWCIIGPIEQVTLGPCDVPPTLPPCLFPASRSISPIISLQGHSRDKKCRSVGPLGKSPKYKPASSPFLLTTEVSI
jgi:hypothetical protein